MQLKVYIIGPCGVKIIDQYIDDGDAEEDSNLSDKVGRLW